MPADRKIKPLLIYVATQNPLVLAAAYNAIARHHEYPFQLIAKTIDVPAVFDTTDGLAELLKNCKSDELVCVLDEEFQGKEECIEEAKKIGIPFGVIIKSSSGELMFLWSDLLAEAEKVR